MVRSRKKTKARRGVNRAKIRQLLTGRDAFMTGTGYVPHDKRLDRNPTLDLDSARQDWAGIKDFLLLEFRKFNPDRICFAECQFDGVEAPPNYGSGLGPFSRLNINPICDQFPTR